MVGPISKAGHNGTQQIRVGNTTLLISRREADTWPVEVPDGGPAPSTRLTVAVPEAGEPLAALRARNAFCITLYNEPWESLRETLCSVILATEETNRLSAHGNVLCVVADGIDRLDAGVLEALESSGFLVRVPMIEDETEIHVSHHRNADLLARWGSPGTNPSASEISTVVVCLKRSNRGKLHSHRVFFELICTRVKPTVCCQLDTGTVLSAASVERLTTCLQSSEDVAAIAPMITTPIPAFDACLLQNWQYHDFALRQAALLPVESSLDLLGVLPGQASMFRWNALRPSSVSGATPIHDPLWAYLHGIAAGSPLRHLMYLSEDRVIGAAIVLDKGHGWKMKYVPEATAVTDACQTYRELFRQRRRWTNSALLCRLWLTRKWSEVLSGANRSRGEKAKLSLALVLQLLVALKEFSAPAQLVALLIVLGRIVAGTSGSGAWLVVALAGTLCVEVLLFGADALGRPLAQNPTSRRARSVIAWISALLFVAVLLTSLSSTALAIALIPAGLVILSMALLLPASSLPILLKTHFSPVQYSLLANSILMYSLWNMHDSTWGTKGLIGGKAAGCETSPHVHTTRAVVLVVWLLVNAAMLSIAIRPGMLSPQLNPVMEITCLIEAVIMLASLGWLLARRLRARTRGARTPVGDGHRP